MFNLKGTDCNRDDIVHVKFEAITCSSLVLIATDHEPVFSIGKENVIFEKNICMQ
jgi:hypothetical protein